jgi:hypothetical protein
MATKKVKAKEVVDRLDPEVIVGSHLTVRKYANGRTELEWDDEALMRDVLEALASVGTDKEKPKARTKKSK